jgi:putative ABC transport system substrate-binding protein
MASHIERRKFLATLGGAAVAWPLAAQAQQQGDRMRRIGVLMTTAEDDVESKAPRSAIGSGLERRSVR